MKTKVRLQASRLFNDLFDLPKEGLPEMAALMQKDWDGVEEKVLSGLEKITGLTFARNYIDVFLVQRNSVKGSISHPLILGVRGDSERDLCVLIHELIHNLMWDNAQNHNWSLKIQKLFPQENKKTAIHVAVHAILEAVYRDILGNPAVIEKDIEYFQDHPDYRRAWEIVRQAGCDTVIAQLRSQ